MTFADMPIDPQALANSGTPYVLAVCLLAVSAALVWVYRTYRSDVREMMDGHKKDVSEIIGQHEAAMTAKRQEFTAELEKLADRHDAAEERWRNDMKAERQEFTQALQKLAEAYTVRLDRIEAKLK